MNWPFVHLSLNHLPVIGVPFVIALLALAWMRRSPELVRVGFGALVVLALLTIAVYLTGEPAEEAIENLAGVSETWVERHEEAALVAFIAMEVLGAVALLGLVLTRGRNPFPARWLGAVLLLSILVVVFLARTAHRGGQIRHDEIRGSTPPTALEGPGAEEAERH